MLIVFYVILVWLKIIVGKSLVFLWLWILRDRNVTGSRIWMNYAAALLVWAAPWVAFLFSQAELYQGHCGLRQGIHDCGVIEFLWTRLRWVGYGMLLDASLLAGVIVLMARSRISREESRAFGLN